LDKTKVFNNLLMTSHEHAYNVATIVTRSLQFHITKPYPNVMWWVQALTL